MASLDSDDYFPSLLLQVIFHVPVVSNVINFIVVLLLLFFSGLLSAGEQALFSLSPEEINGVKDEKSIKDRFIRQLLDRPQQTHNSIFIFRIIINVAIVVLAIYGIHSFTGLTTDFDFSYILITIGIVILLLVFCGIMPKFIVKNKALQVARNVAAYLKTIDWFFRPLTKLMNYSTVPISKNELNETAIISKDSDEKEMLEEIIHFYNKTADEIMIPRLDMTAADIKCCFKEVLDIIIKTGYSRIPIYEETEDNIKGILYVKDLLLSIKEPDSFQWEKFIRPAYFVPETKKIDDLLENFRANKVHIAIVVDEFGCTSGLVTMEDIIEEIIGEISDEYDDDEKHFFLLPDGSYIFEGKVQLNDFFRETDMDASEFGKMSEDVETLAGLLLKIKGTLPSRREVIDYKHYRFRILEADERRVLKVKFSLIGKSTKKNIAVNTIIGSIFLSLCISCMEYTPKPCGFYRIELPEAHYKNFSLNNLPYSFNVSQLATIELPPLEESGNWINIVYTSLNVKLYCNYQKMTPTTFPDFVRECEELVSRSVKRADAITEQAYDNPNIHVYGTLFQIDGETVSPVQFMMTDSANHFFRGALYYECKPNFDSLLPVTAYLHEDIIELIQSFHWK